VIQASVVDETGTLMMPQEMHYSDSVDVCGIGGSTGAKSVIITGYGYLYPHSYPGSQVPHVYWYHQGSTSYSAAQVSALAGLLRSIYPDSSPAFIKHEIQRGAIPVDTAFGNRNTSWQYKLGAGRINAYRSLTQWGRVRNDTTWTKFAYVSADLRIDEGKTLTIEPGTTIYFAPDDNQNMYDPTVLEFRVYGTLIAEGTASNPIEFRSFAESPQPGDWSGIQVFGNAASASLAYCNISHAYHGIKSYRPVELLHCNISDCEVHGVYLEGSGAAGSEITYCKMNGNGSCGIMINSSNNVSITGCESNNGYQGIYLNASSNTHIGNTLMKSNIGNGIKKVSSGWGIINLCVVEDNNQQGIYLSQSSGIISNTRIWKNTANGLYCVGASSQPMVDHSKIKQNTTGVRVASGACPILGDSEDNGYNSIYNHSLCHVYGSPSYTIMAENCWWGNGPGEMPDPKMFKGIVDYNPLLESDPVFYLAPSASKKGTILSLAQNCPNPSVGSGVTKIMYSIPHENENERVSLTIYDVNGRRIRTLVDDAQAAGTYQAYWDGKGEKGQNAAPGIYFYKLVVGKSSISKKLILFR